MSAGESIDRDPIGDLHRLLETDAARHYFEIAQRCESRKGRLEDITEVMRTVEHPGMASMWLGNLKSGIRELEENSVSMKDNFLDTRERGLSLVELTAPVLELAIDEVLPEEIPTIYSSIYTKEEVAGLSDRAMYYKGGVELDIAADIGMPADAMDNFDLAHVFVGMNPTLEANKKGLTTLGHSLTQSANYLFFANAVTDARIFNNRILGIGEYGLEYAQRLVMAETIGAIAIRKSLEVFVQWEEEVGEEEVSKLVRSILPAGEIEGASQLPQQLTAFEGILSVMQTVNMLTSQRHEDYEDPDSLVEDIILNGLVGRFARKMPALGIFGPLSLAGLHAFEPLSGSGNELRLSPELESNMTRTRRRYRDEALMGIVNSGKNPKREKLGFNGCPVAHSRSGSNTMNNGVDTYALLFKQAYDKAKSWEAKA